MIGTVMKVRILSDDSSLTKLMVKRFNGYSGLLAYNMGFDEMESAELVAGYGPWLIWDIVI